MAEVPDLHVKVIPDMSEVDQAVAVQKPSVGRIVHYKVAAGDAEQINRRRADAERNMAGHRDRADGSQVHVGNRVVEGDVYPATIVRVFDPSSTTSNLQVLLDGNDTYWATSRQAGDGPGTWHWPERVS